MGGGKLSAGGLGVDMTHKDFAAHYSAMARDMHKRAQQAKKDVADLNARRDFIGAFRARERWAEYRHARDQYKEKAALHKMAEKRGGA